MKLKMLFLPRLNKEEKVTSITKKCNDCKNYPLKTHCIKRKLNGDYE